MISVIIAGGSGTRLWPLSTPDYPKHLLKVNGESDSLLQKTYARAKSFADTVYVVTDKSHAHHVKSQLGELSDDHIIVEPARRGTASCIVASLAHLAKRHAEDEPIAILSADHYVRDTEGFRRSFKVAGSVSEKTKRIVLVGVEPTSPATGFGYIQKDGLFDENNYVFNVHSFKEKPDYDTAREYLQAGNYLWNCGYFVGSFATFKSKMSVHAPQLAKNLDALTAASNSEEFDKTYLGFKNDTIDYALIEKVNDLLVVPASFDWMDLGSYADMHKASISDARGNHVLGQVEIESVENSFLYNYDKTKPVAVIGLNNIVVVNTKDGILVARKDLAKEIGTLSKKINGEKKMKKVIAFDLDDTLAVTKSAISDRMSELLNNLLEKYEVCVISGGKFEQFELQLLDNLQADPKKLEKLHIMPTCGTRYYRFDSESKNWKQQYAEDLSEKDKELIIKTLTAAAKKLGYWPSNPRGEVIEDRGSQITFSALGQQALPEEKYKWDPEGIKKHKLRDYVVSSLPHLEVRVGGTTSVDITKIGIDKAYGMKKLMEALSIEMKDIFFIGDKLEEGGNDYPVKAMGVDSMQISHANETELAIEAIINVS